MNDDRHIRQTKPRIFRHIGSAVIFSVFANILLLTGPIFMLQVYDRVLPSGSRETLVVLMVLVAGLYGLMALLDFARGRLFAAIGYRLQAELDGPVLSRRLAGRAADAPALGDLDILRTIWGAPAMAALADLPWTPIFILALYLFHPALGALALAGTLLVVLLWIGTHVLTRRLARSAAAADCVALRLAAEAERNADLIRAQAMLADIELRIATSRNAGIADGARAGWRGGLFSSATKSVRLLLQSAMLGLGAWLVMAGALSPGAMVAASILLGRALQPVESLVAGWSGLDAARRAWARVAPVLRDVQAPAAGIELPEPEPRLAVENLTIWHPGAPRPALRQVSFELEPGQALGVIGPSGSGKSTLARSLCGLAQGRGDLRLGGTPIARIDAHMLGRIIGYAPQDAGLFTGTVAQNIARMAAAPDDQAVLKAAAKASIHDFILSLPAGYDTPLAADGAPLSTGQRQRVALARAFYGAPRLLILDEPIAALDAEGAAALNTAIRGFKAARGAAVIMTHRPMAIAECDMLLLLENGRAIAFGPREAVLSQHIGNAARVRRGMKGAA